MLNKLNKYKFETSLKENVGFSDEFEQDKCTYTDYYENDKEEKLIHLEK